VETWLNISIVAVIQILMLVGLFGLVIPIFPGIVIMWLAALGYGIITGFTSLGWIMFAIISLLMLAGITVDNILMGGGARKGGASWLSIGAAILAGIVGTILLPPIGGVIAAPLAVLLVEYTRVGDWQKSWFAVRGMLTGWGLSFVARFLIGLLIMIVWWMWVIFR
jgi:uncharacterized protein YqgC (DUF456 family)